VSFVLLSDCVALAVKIALGSADRTAVWFFLSVFGFVFVMGWFTACAAVALSSKRLRPLAISVITFPVFSFVLSATVAYTLLRPTRKWKPIPHSGRGKFRA
jgi:ABC-type transport system involved in cytochrome c biogenesis permease component